MNNKEVYRCVLDSALRDCPHYDQSSNICVDGDKCCFREKIEIELPKKKEPKWFEKYYKYSRVI